ncbi:MAG: hypothetical protein ACFCUT_17615 [Kiloniellaceae bacterium]
MTGSSHCGSRILSGALKALRGTVKGSLALSIVAVSLTRPGQAAEPVIEQMPAELETRFALSAVPAALRDRATVYLLDPQKGYDLSRQGTSGVTCLVERTVWELADFRNDIYIPLCYDAEGTRTYLQVIMDAAALRGQGLSPAALKAEIEQRYGNATYRVPEKAGVSYMVGPIFRTVGPPDMAVRTLAMPHLMFYAPYVTNEDIGALPDLASHASLLNPFIDKQGNPEQSYMIQLVGEAEKAKILADEKTLIDDLCAYRDVLCLPDMKHPE